MVRFGTRHTLLALSGPMPKLASNIDAYIVARLQPLTKLWLNFIAAGQTEHAWSIVLPMSMFRRRLFGERIDQDDAQYLAPETSIRYRLLKTRGKVFGCGERPVLRSWRLNLFSGRLHLLLVFSKA